MYVAKPFLIIGHFSTYSGDSSKGLKERCFGSSVNIPGFFVIFHTIMSRLFSVELETDS